MTNPGDIDVLIREVGPRDGLQIVADIMPTDDKLAWCAAEAAAGVREIEVCSFVPPKLLPQFQDAGEVVRRTRDIGGLTVAALVPNAKGAERAIEAGVDKIDAVISVSEAHNQSNLRRSVDQSVEDLERTLAIVASLPKDGRPAVSVALATSFGCSIAGPTPPEDVRRLALRVAGLGVDEIMLADTVGYGAPRQVGDLFRDVIADVGAIAVGAHFHNTRGMGCANARAAYEAGVRIFDASLAGLGGCPYAPGATGNVVTEDLVFMFEADGVRTGIDLEALIAVREILARGLPSVELLGELARAGLPKGFARVAQ